MWTSDRPVGCLDGQEDQEDQEWRGPVMCPVAWPSDASRWWPSDVHHRLPVTWPVGWSNGLPVTWPHGVSMTWPVGVAHGVANRLFSWAVRKDQEGSQEGGLRCLDGVACRCFLTVARGRCPCAALQSANVGDKAVPCAIPVQSRKCSLWLPVECAFSLAVEPSMASCGFTGLVVWPAM